MDGINNKSNGVVRMYVTTSVPHKPEVRIDLLTIMQIVNNLSVNRNVCQITMRFVEANCAWNN